LSDVTWVWHADLSIPVVPKNVTTQFL